MILVHIAKGVVVRTDRVVAQDVAPLHVVAGQPVGSVRELASEASWQ